MIGKIIHSQSINECIKYVVGKEGADIVGGNISGTTPESISDEFNEVLQGRAALKEPICHIPLSLNPGEYLSNYDWRELGEKFLSEMGFRNVPYVIVRHTDTAFTDENGDTLPRDHVHIVASRVRQNGSVVSDSWEYIRCQKVLEKLEEEYRLYVARHSWESENRLSTNHDRYVKETEVIAEKPIKLQLQDLIDELVQRENTIEGFVITLAEFGVETHLGRAKDGEINGISFKYKNVALAGSHLGRSYSFPKIKERLGKVIALDDASNDVELLLPKVALENEPKSPHINEELAEKHRVRTYLKERIDAALSTALTLENFIELLEKSEIMTAVMRRRDGSPRGISFNFQGTNAYDSDIGRNYSAAKLVTRLAGQTETFSIKPELVSPPVFLSEGCHLRLRDSIRTAADGSPTMTDFVHRLASVGIDTSIKTDRNGRVRGISYVFDSNSFRGTELGREFSFSGLQKYLGVTYVPDRSENFGTIHARESDDRSRGRDELIRPSAIQLPDDQSTDSRQFQPGAAARVGDAASGSEKSTGNVDSRRGKSPRTNYLPLVPVGGYGDDISGADSSIDESIGDYDDEADANRNISHRTEIGQSVSANSQFRATDAIISDNTRIDESSKSDELAGEPDQATNLRQQTSLANNSTTLSASSSGAVPSTTAADGDVSSDNANARHQPDSSNSADPTVIFTSSYGRSEQLRIDRSNTSAERLPHIQPAAGADIAATTYRSESSSGNDPGDIGTSFTRDSDDISDGTPLSNSGDRSSNRQRRQLKAALAEMYIRLAEQVEAAGESLSREQIDRGVAMMVMQNPDLSMNCLVNSPRALQLHQEGEAIAIDYLERITEQAKHVLEMSAPRTERDRGSG